MLQGTKLEVESVLRETCDIVLEDPNIPRTKARLRAIAMQILGEAYMSVKKDDGTETEESEYVRVETQNSRKRDSQRGQPS